MADVFLSYARPNLKDAKRIAELLRAGGASVWYDEILPAHRPYTDVLALPVAQACAAMGDATASIDLLRGYYFGRGEWAALAPPAGDQDRLTGPLFHPPMHSLWTDKRFTELVRSIDLADYWQASGKRPDYLAV